MEKGWTLKKFLAKMPALHDPILIEGLPGIGNVGKITADFIADEVQAQPLLRLQSTALPNSAFVGEDNLLELPAIDIYYKKYPKAKSGGKQGNADGKRDISAISKQGKKGSCGEVEAKAGKRDLLFVVGDIQPSNEEASYELCDTLLGIMQDMKVKEFITLGGVGLPSPPEKPRLFITGNSNAIVRKYLKGTSATDKLFGAIGPIVGVTGLLVGLAKYRKIPGVCILAETHAHPLHLGIKGSRQMVSLLDNKLGLGVDLKRLDREVKSAEKELSKRLKQVKGQLKDNDQEDASYIR